MILNFLNHTPNLLNYYKIVDSRRQISISFDFFDYFSPLIAVFEHFLVDFLLDSFLSGFAMNKYQTNETVEDEKNYLAHTNNICVSNTDIYELFYRRT